MVSSKLLRYFRNQRNEISRKENSTELFVKSGSGFRGRKRLIAAVCIGTMLLAVPAVSLAATGESDKTDKTGKILNKLIETNEKENPEKTMNDETLLLLNQDIGNNKLKSTISRSSSEIKSTSVDGNQEWNISVPDGKTRFDDLAVTYKNALKIGGKKYNVRMTVTEAASSKKSVIRISKNNMEIGTASASLKKTVKTNKSKVAAIASKIATHKPRYNYVLGGRTLSTTGGGIDCAHFVGHVYKKAGIDITSNGADSSVNSLRTVLKKNIVKTYSSGSPIQLKEMKKGDIIIFFAGGHDSHTAIYIGGGKIAHAGDPRLGVTVTDMRYNEKTGVVGYSGKTLQYIIRLEKNKKQIIQKPNSDIKINVKTEVVDPETGKAVNTEKLKMNMYDPIKKKTLSYSGSNNQKFSFVERYMATDKDGSDRITYTASYKADNSSRDVIVKSNEIGRTSISYLLNAQSKSKASWQPVFYKEK
jgi:cell wall-associated NlpC family hydrolase